MEGGSEDNGEASWVRTEQGIGEARTTGDDIHAEGAEQVGEGAASRVRDAAEKAEQARPKEKPQKQGQQEKQP